MPNLTSREDLEHVVTPINVSVLAQRLRETEYDQKETQFLIEGFSKGFDIGYNRPLKRKKLSNNIPFSVGNAADMWSKVMKEVKCRRFCGTI